MSTSDLESGQADLDEQKRKGKELSRPTETPPARSMEDDPGPSHSLHAIDQPTSPARPTPDVTIWDCVVSYREHLQAQPDEFSSTVLAFLTKYLLSQDDAHLVEEVWDYLASACAITFRHGMQIMENPRALVRALSAKPPRVVLATTDTKMDFAAAIALFGSQLNISTSLFARIILSLDQNPNRLGDVPSKLSDNTIVLSLDRHWMFLSRQSYNRLQVNGRSGEYIFALIVRNPESSPTRHIGTAVIRALAGLSRHPEIDLVQIDECAYLLGRIWLRLLWNSSSPLSQMRVPASSNPYTWSYNRVFEDERGLTNFQAVVFEWGVGDALIKRWLTEMGLQDPPTIESNPQRTAFKTEMALALNEAKVLSEGLLQFTSSQSLKASLLSIEESKRSIEEAHAITRLTQLAFVFLPLTFVTGVFGMNIKPFGGDAATWKFVVTLLTIAVPAFLFGVRTAKKDLKKRWFSVISRMAGWAANRLDPYGEIEDLKSFGALLDSPNLNLSFTRYQRYSYKLSLWRQRWDLKARDVEKRQQPNTL